VGVADRTANTADKLYCYVDESGQHTRGELFVVAAVILAADRAALGAAIEAAEGASGKGKVKWAKADREKRWRFIDLIAREDGLHHALYGKVFRGVGRQYQALTALTIAEALNLHARHRDLAEYKATVVIDGLTRAQGHCQVKPFGRRRQSESGERSAHTRPDPACTSASDGQNWPGVGRFRSVKT